MRIILLNFSSLVFYRIQDQQHTNQDCMQNQLVLDLLFQMFLHRNSKLLFQLPWIDMSVLSSVTLCNLLLIIGQSSDNNCSVIYSDWCMVHSTLVEFSEIWPLVIFKLSNSLLPSWTTTDDVGCIGSTGSRVLVYAKVWPLSYIQIGQSKGSYAHQR